MRKCHCYLKKPIGYCVLALVRIALRSVNAESSVLAAAKPLTDWLIDRDDTRTRAVWYWTTTNWIPYYSGSVRTKVCVSQTS